MAKKKKGQRADGLVEIKRKMTDGTYKHFYGSSKAECEAKHRAALIEAAQAKEEQDAGPLFKDLAAKWWSQREPQLSPNTSAHYKYILKKIVSEFGDRYVSEITPSMVSYWLTTFKEAGKAKKTASNYKIVLSDVLQYGHDHYNTGLNIARGTDMPHNMPKAKRKMPTDQQLKVIFDNYKNDWVCRIYYILAFTGLRLGELVALQWCDIDLDKNEISVSKSVYWKGSLPNIKSTKTDAGVRTIPYLPQVQAVLEPYRQKNIFYYVIHGPNSTGERPMSGSSYRKMLDHAKRMGLTVTPHMLRHAFTTLCCESNVDARTAGAIMGWEDPARMITIYADIRKQKISQAGDLLATANYL